MAMNSGNWLSRAKRGWMLAGIVLLVAILLALGAPPAHGQPCPHSQESERSAPPPPHATPDCCRGSRLAVLQCGRDSMATGPQAPAAFHCAACSPSTAFARLRVRAAGQALPWTSFHTRSMRVLR